MYHTSSSKINTQLFISQYLGVCTATEVIGNNTLLVRNDGQSLYHWASEFTAVNVEDLVTFTRNGETVLAVVVTVDAEAGELELILESGERGWADAHTVKAVVARNVVYLYA